MVIDGVEGKKYDEIGLGSLIFSPNSNYVTYGAIRDTEQPKQLIVVNGIQGEEYDEIAGMGITYLLNTLGRNAPSALISRDGKRWSYAGRRGKDWFLVVDGEIKGKYDAVKFLVFSPDGKRLAYGMNEDKWFVVVDTVVSEKYDDLQFFKFSPNGRRFSYEVKI